MKKNAVIKLPFPELLFPYSPVAKPMPPPPIENVCDAPRVQVEFNCSLVPYLLGLLEVYRYKDSFTGTDEQKTIAVGVMRQLMEELAMAGCGCDEQVTIKRINPETGEVEISTDNGETWTTDPQSPYVLATIYKPLTGADGAVKRCEAANNVVEHLKDIQAAFSLKIGEINNVTDMLASIIVIAVGMLFLPLAGAALVALLSPLLTKLFEVARFLSGTTQAAYDALFTEENWTLTRCILYCNVGSDGTFSQGAWSTIQTEMKDQMGAGAQQAGANLAAMIDVWGVVGLNNAARIGSGAEGNCDDCPCDDTWCYLFDFVNVGAEDWVLFQRNGSEFGAYELGTGWVYTDNTAVQSGVTTASREVRIARTFDNTEITKVVIFYNYTFGASDSMALQALDLWVGGTNVEVVPFSGMVNGNAQEFEWTGEGMSVTSLQVGLRSSRDISAPLTYSGNAVILEVLVEGHGTNPFGEDNCEPTG